MKRKQGFGTCQNCARTKFRALCGTKLSTCANFEFCAAQNRARAQIFLFRAARNYANEITFLLPVNLKSVEQKIMKKLNFLLVVLGKNHLVKK
jgi:hypothetical protein